MKSGEEGFARSTKFICVTSLICGFVVGFANHLDAFGIIAFPALAIWFRSLDGKPVCKAAKSTFIFAFSDFSITWFWVFGALEATSGWSLVLGFCLLSGLLVIAATWVAALALLASKARTQVPLPLAFSALVAANEGVFPYLFELPFPPVSLAGLETPLAVLVGIGGQPLLSLVTLSLGWQLGKRPVLTGLVFGFTFTFGLAPIPSDIVPLVDTGVVAIRTQGKIGTDLRSLVEKAAKSDPDLILLPENAVRKPLVDGQVFGGFGQIDVPVIFGAPRKIVNPVLEYRTSMFLLRNGHLTVLFDKRFLVPFYETSPIAAVFSGAKAVGRGEVATVREVAPGIRIYPMLCFEVLFPIWERPDADLIVLLSSDRHFASGVAQHILEKFTLMRALESDVSLVRVSDVGDPVFVN